MDVAKNGGTVEEFVTVVSVDGHPPRPPTENFVTVLSIGNDTSNDKATSKEEKEGEEGAARTSSVKVVGAEGPLEEEVEVYRLPGERLGFGLKFEGGNKTSERVRRLFVQSCAEQSPASRARCSWGTLGEGDEVTFFFRFVVPFSLSRVAHAHFFQVLSIDGVPVTHMTRLDCVRRLKESQLVIKLMVRCRGALRPEVVSAEKKSSPESKVPPELPSAPPPVPPRKLRLARGSADGEANPNPVAKKSWNVGSSQQFNNNSQTSSQSSSRNGSPGSTDRQSKSGEGSSKSTSYESCESSPRSGGERSVRESPKGSPPAKERSPEVKSKQVSSRFERFPSRSRRFEYRGWFVLFLGTAGSDGVRGREVAVRLDARLDVGRHG